MNRRRSLPISAALLIGAAGCSSGATHAPAATTTTGTATTSSTAGTTATATPPIPARWSPLPPAPISGRIAAGTVWTGTEMIVWGGVSDRDGARTAVADGAAYNPTTKRWRTLAAPPAGVIGDAGNGSAWTGERAIFWAGNSPDGPAGGAVYDPNTDTWLRLAPGPLGAREGYSSAWTGKELLIIGGASGDMIASPVGAAIDPRTGAWRRLRAFDDIEALQGPGTVWTGRQLLVIGERSLCPELGSACRQSEPFFASYDPVTDILKPIDLADAPISARHGELRPIAWTGSVALFSDQGNSAAGIAIYDPRTDEWRTGRRPPCAVADPSSSQTAWIGDRYVEACGTDGLQIYDPATNSWQRTKSGASPLNSRAGSAIAWTGSQLLVWSGAEKKPLNPTPNDGAALRLTR
jgi:hypothetical protein